LTALAFTRGLVEHLHHVRVTEQAIEEAKNFLTGRRELRKKRLKKERGYEYVVELVFRPRITQYAKNALGITSDLNRRIYSSHFHTTSDTEREWKREWECFKRAHPEVDTDDAGHSRRADLFIAMDVGLVSIEFKYLRAQSKPAAKACVTQIRQHLTKHRASVLVVYAATPPSAGLASTAEEISVELRGRNGFVVVVTGPPIEFP
jgi:hypothetical protein